jgi:toxin secretion/phage lysis holin
MVNKKVFPILTGLFALFFGDTPTAVKIVHALMIFQIFDFATALLKCFMLGEQFNYRIFFKGLVKKITMLLAVSFGFMLDKFNVLNVQNISFEIAIASGFLTIEILSILNNFKKMGFNIPILEKYIKLDK